MLSWSRKNGVDNLLNWFMFGLQAPSALQSGGKAGNGSPQCSNMMRPYRFCKTFGITELHGSKTQVPLTPQNTLILTIGTSDSFLEAPKP